MGCDLLIVSWRDARRCGCTVGDLDRDLEAGAGFGWMRPLEAQSIKLVAFEGTENSESDGHGELLSDLRADTVHGLGLGLGLWMTGLVWVLGHWYWMVGMSYRL